MSIFTVRVVDNEDSRDLFFSISVLPEHGPSLSGLRSKYRPGERVRVNCTSGQSRPETSLAWYINGEPITTLAPTHCSENGLVTTSLFLDFVVDAMHFKNNIVKVKVS